MHNTQQLQKRKNWHHFESIWIQPDEAKALGVSVVHGLAALIAWLPQEIAGCPWFSKVGLDGGINELIQDGNRRILVKHTRRGWMTEPSTVHMWSFVLHCSWRLCQQSQWANNSCGCCTDHRFIVFPALLKLLLLSKRTFTFWHCLTRTNSL